MAIAEEQQKTLDVALKDIQETSKSLAKERADLAETVRNISAQVGESASESLLNALGEAQARFNDEMHRTTSQALKTAQNANQELEKAKKTVAELTSDLRGQLTREISKSVFILSLVFCLIGTASLGGVYWYFLHQAKEAQESASYWIQKGNDAFEKCQRLKNCRS